MALSSCALAPGPASAHRSLAEFPHIRLSQWRQQLEINLLFSKGANVFAEPDTGQPVGEIGHDAGRYGALLGCRPVVQPRGRRDRAIQPVAGRDPTGAVLMPDSEVGEILVTQDKQRLLL